MDGLQNHSPSNNGRAARAFVVAIASLMLISVFFGIIGNVKASDGTLFPPHSDHAVDSDSPPDGLYNELIVNVSVDVTVSGLFYLTGNLRDTSGVFLIESQFAMAGLSIGVQTIQLEFTGYLIQASGFDGPYQVNLRLFDDSFVVLDTGIHATKPYSAASFQSLPAYFAPPHSDYALDNDGDMLDDYLVASVNVKVNVSGSYEIDATLFDSTGVFFITSGVNDTFLPAGMRTADIAFLGYAIRSSGFDGPYKVELQLFDGSSNLLDNGIYFTSPYSSNGFEQPPAAFLPPHSDQGLDLNGNSLFEYLVVTTSVAVFVEGTYNVEGVSAFGSFENQTYLSTGIQTVELRFIGFEISKSGADGPYLIDLVVRDVFLNVLDNNTYNTAAYSKNDFEPKPPCSLSPPHWDFGVDTDGDTKSNYLVITVNVTVDAPGYYEIRGELYDSMSMRLITSDTNSTRLDVGPNTLNLLFDGVTIYLSRINGPYGVYLALFDDMDFFLGFDIYTTRPYFYTDFDMPPAVLSPPHSDYGLDTDIPPDGSFNFLVVNASIRVKEPGWFLLYGILLDGSLNPITQAQIFANLSAGPSSLPLEFNGLNISRSGINGPYVIFMELLYFEQQLPVYVDTDMYFTGPYNYTDFMAPSLATIWGYVYGASDSSPVDLAQITVVNYTYGWISQAESNVSGYYEINAFDGDFSVLLDGRDLQANLSFISVAGSAEVTRYLEESIPNPIDSTLVFPDWDNIGYDARTEIVTDNESTRFMIDLMVGNRDGYVDQNESDIMESFLASSMPPLPSNTTGQFYVDGIYYDLVPDSDALDLDALGPVVSPNPSFMTVVANYTSSSTIPVSNIHWLELNVTYDNDEETNVYNGQLPSGFTLWDYLPVSNVSFSGIGSQNIMIDPSGDWDPFDANDSVWVNLTVGQGAPDVEAPQVLNAQINDQPSPTYGLSTLPSVVYLNASIDDIGRGNVPIGGANYTIDAQNWSSSTPMNPTDGSFDSPSEDVTVMIVPQPVNTTYCVYGWDAMSNSNTTGSCATITIVDDMGPQIQNILITPSTFFLSTAPPTATLTATIDDTLSGSSTVSGANYTTPSSDSWPGTPMIAADGTFDESVENIAANVPLPTSAGVFDYYVHAWDVLMKYNDSAPAVQITIIDDVGPALTGLELNGQSAPSVLAGTPVLVNATVDDTGGRGDTSIQGANYTIDGDWATSTAMFPADGTFDTASEAIIITIDTNGWADGTYQICIYGWDNSPNYNVTGACGSLTIFSVDDKPPNILNVRLDGSTSITLPPGSTVNLTASIDDASSMGSNILAANYSVDMAWTDMDMFPTDGAFDSPTEDVYATINTTGWADGTYEICVHGSDDTPNFNTTFGACAQLIIQTPPDPQSPTVENETAEPSTQVPDDFVRISADIYDNVQVYSVSVIVTDSSGDLVGNYTMNYDPVNDEYYYSDAYAEVGTYTFTIWASDTSDNWNFVSGSFEIIEGMTAPSFLEEYWWLLIVIVTAVMFGLVMVRKLKFSEPSPASMDKAPPVARPEPSQDEGKEPGPLAPAREDVEMESVVKCLSCGDAVLVVGDTDLLKTRCEHCGSTLLEVSKGFNYLIVDDDPSVAYQGFKSILKKDVPGLCISTTFPEKLNRRFDVEGADMYWLTDTATETGVDTLDPKRLDFEMMRAISNFLKKYPEGAVMIDGIENLIVENGFDSVFRFIKKINDLASVGGATIFVPLAPSSLGKDELAVLKKEFDKVQILTSTAHSRTQYGH